MTYDELPHECKKYGPGKECDGLQWMGKEEGYTCIAPQCPYTFRNDPNDTIIKLIYK